MLSFARRLWCRIIGPRFQFALGGLGGSSCCCCNVTFQCSPAGPQPGVTIDDPLSGFSVAGTIGPAGKVTLAIPGDGSYDVTFSGPACPGDISQSMDLACGQTYPAQCCGGQCGGAPTICLYQYGYILYASWSCPPSIWAPGGAGPPPVMSGAQVTIRDPTGKVAFQGTTDATGCVVYDLHEIVGSALEYTCTMSYAGQTANLPAGVFQTCLNNAFGYSCTMQTGCWGNGPAPGPPGLQGTVYYGVSPIYGPGPWPSPSFHTDADGCTCILNGYPGFGQIGWQPDNPRVNAWPVGDPAPPPGVAAPGFVCGCCNLPICTTLKVSDSVLGEGTLTQTAGGWYGYIDAAYPGYCHCPAGIVPLSIGWNCHFDWSPGNPATPPYGTFGYSEPVQTVHPPDIPQLCSNLFGGGLACPGFVESAGMGSMLRRYEVSFSCDPHVNDTWTLTMDPTLFTGSGLGCPCYIYEGFGATGDACGCQAWTSCPDAPIGEVEYCFVPGVGTGGGLPSLWGDAPTTVTWNIVDDC